MQLRDHLKTGHSMEDLKQPNLNGVLGILELSLRITPIGNGHLCVDDSNACPLAFLGCTFRSSCLWGYKNPSSLSHLPQHELIERVKGYDAIMALDHDWSAIGAATCPVCRERVCNSNDSNSDFIKHVYNLHTKYERAMHATELGEILQLYLLGGERVFGCRKEFQELRNELEGGFIPSPANEA
jgi:hypothetical protein